MSSHSRDGSLPPTHKALLLETRETGIKLKTLPTPQPNPGNAIIRIIASGVLPYHRETYNGKRGMPFPTPIVGGFGAIGYIAALGSDATILKIGQLVYVDCVIRARDDPDTFFLSSIFEGINDGSKKLMRDVWRDGTFAEYTKFPLENCFPLIQSKLCATSGELGLGLGLEYTLSDLAYISFLLVPFAGLRDIGFEPGETIIICPATGFYGSLAVFIAIAMGGNVIAMGRNEEKLSKLVDDIQCRFGTLGKGNANIQTVQMTGDEGEDVAKLKSFGIVDAVLDITPSEASSSNHTRCAIKALRRGGRVSLMGSVKNIGVSEILFNDITLKGKMMYERETVVKFLKMLHSGLFPRGEGFVKTKDLQLEDWKEAFDEGGRYNGVGKCVVFTP